MRILGCVVILSSLWCCSLTYIFYINSSGRIQNENAGGFVLAAVIFLAGIVMLNPREYFETLRINREMKRQKNKEKAIIDKWINKNPS